MAGVPKKQLALDANVVLDLAEGKDFAHDFREEFQARGYEFFLPPTTVAELNVLSLYGGKKISLTAGCSSCGRGSANPSRFPTRSWPSPNISVAACQKGGLFPTRNGMTG